MRKRTTRPDYKESLEQLSEEELYKKACIKAMAVLERSDRTEAELRLKLKTAGFDEDICDKAIEYVRSFHYIDNARFAENYVRNHCNLMSRRELSNKLVLKGVDKDLITLAFDKLDEEYAELNSEDAEILSAESAAAVAALRKKLNGKTAIDDAQKKKVLAYMYRKGYRRENIDEAFEFLDISIDSDWFSN